MRHIHHTNAEAHCRKNANRNVWNSWWIWTSKKNMSAFTSKNRFCDIMLVSVTIITEYKRFHYHLYAVGTRTYVMVFIKAFQSKCSQTVFSTLPVLFTRCRHRHSYFPLIAICERFRFRVQITYEAKEQNSCGKYSFFFDYITNKTHALPMK